MDKKFYNMKDLAEIIPVGTNNLYNLVNSEGFPAIKINRRIVIPAEAFEEWIHASTGKQFIV